MGTVSFWEFPGALILSVCYIYSIPSKELGLKLYVAHVHHGIRAQEADRDAEFVRQICERLDVPCKVFHLNIPAMARQKKMSEEEAGRQARYEIFEKMAEELQADKIAVAHNLNDNSETVLFNLFRGSKFLGAINS